MPRATVKEGDGYKFPAGLMMPARLDAVTERNTEFLYKAHHKAVERGEAKVGDKGVVTKWRWVFEITEGDYKGEKAYAETNPGLSTAEHDRVRQWGETLMGRTIGLGEDFDTDPLIGTPCIITIRHDEPRPSRDGTTFYPCEVDEVFEAAGAADFDPGF